jgi:hypothetical protein
MTKTYGVPVFIDFNDKGYMIRVSLMPEEPLPSTARKDAYMCKGIGYYLEAWVKALHPGWSSFDFMKRGIILIIEWAFKPKPETMAEALVYLIASMPSGYDALYEYIFANFIPFPQQDAQEPDLPVFGPEDGAK